MLPENYNIRVYGLCLGRDGHVLVTDERRGRHLMTKFPGGGHHFGEGLGETVVREFMEETGTRVSLIGLFYINDFLQISAFNPKDQLISIYYLVEAIEPLQVAVSTALNDFGTETGDAQAFRWVALQNLEESQFTYPIDKIVATKLKQNRAYLPNLAGNRHPGSEVSSIRAQTEEIES